MKNVFARLQIKIKKQALLFAVLGLSFLAFGLPIAASNKVGATSKPDEDASTKLVVTRLNSLESKLALLQETLNKPSAALDLSVISNQLNELSLYLEKFKPLNSEQINQQLSDTLNHTESNLGQQLTAIKDVVSRIAPHKEVIQYLKVETLPFKVVSVDSIQQVPVASISYDFKTVPLEKGDQLAGWKVVALDYSKQRLELENSKKERVLITHEHIG